MKRLTVLGASGFLGRALLGAARSRHFEVRAVTRGHRADFGPDVEVSVVADYLSIPAPRDSQESLVHLAESNLVGGSHDAAAALRVVDAAADRGYAYLCYASSAAVYGDRSDVPHRASGTAVPAGDYGRSKLQCEARVRAAGGGAARLTNLIGPGQSRASVLTRILEQIPGRGPLRLRSLAPVRDFCWVTDAADAIVAACEAGLQGAFNVGAGESVSIGELARRALDVAGEGARAVEAEETAEAAASMLRVDISETAAACGWSPATSLSRALEILVSERLAGVQR